MDQIQYENKGEGVVNPIELVNEVRDVFSPPIVHRRLIELLQDGDNNKQEIADVVSHDPGLLARVLHAANNSSDGSSREIVDAYDAVSAINDNELRTIITTATAIDSFQNVDTDLVDINDFWNHSVCCGLAARILAERCEKANPEHAFIAGVLHDIGQLVIYHALPQLATEVLRKAGEPEAYRYRAEKEIIGITHADVGAELLKSWGLPEYLHEVVQFHHEPAKATNHPVETALVHISTSVANRIEPSWKMDLVQRESLAQINPYVWTVTDLSPEVIHPTLEEVNVESFGVMCLIDPKSMFIF